MQKLLDAGARFAGKTQTDELAFSLIGQNVHFPHPVNPAAPGRVTGGSSSGSAAAVAGGLADIATGSDTGGSMRAPASFCGLIGLRTTHGRISLEGTMPLAPSFDTFGWFARDVETYEAVGEVLLGQDSHTTPAHPAAVGRSARRARPGSCRSRRIQAAGRHRRRRHRQPDPSGAAVAATDELYWCFRKLQAREAWAAHGAWITGREDRLGEATLERFDFGKTVSDADVAAEKARRDAFRAELRDLLGDDGFLVLPTVPGVAPKSNGTPRTSATSASVPSACSAGPACRVSRRSPCRSARSTARRSASRCSVRPTATWR